MNGNGKCLWVTKTKLGKFTQRCNGMTELGKDGVYEEFCSKHTKRLEKIGGLEKNS